VTRPRPEDHPALPLLTAAEMREWDARALEEHGIPERVLMESAGRAAAAVIHELHPAGRVAVAVGKGNNGGDALVVLRALRARGRDVVAVPQDESAMRPALLHGWAVPVVAAEAAEEAFAGASVIVDGILGTGATGAPRGSAIPLIRAIVGAGRPVVALDGPSGVDLTTGAAAGEVVTSEVTVTFGAAKRGHLVHPGRTHTGRLVVVEVGFPPLAEGEASASLVTAAWAERALPAIPWNAHKGTLGRVVVVAGRPGMGGAAILAGMGALRAGSGVVRILSPADNRIPIQTAIPEALFLPREDEETRGALENATAIVIGPGMGVGDMEGELLRMALSASGTPVIMDADAITLLAGDAASLPRNAVERVLLTPHPLELARLMGMELEEVVADPFEAAERAAERFSCTVLLKGAPSLIASPGRPTLVNSTGHSGVATGGMGDTLAGVAGAMAAAGASPREAGALALFYCGRAAEFAGRGRGLLPRDVAEALPRAIEAPDTGTLLRAAPVLLDLAAPR
jgi:ADP-dependent NAD(P)H-hydrate dehydratase / NAD(P)H-hydrate epimerase